MIFRRLLKITFGTLVLFAFFSRFIEYRVQENLFIHSTSECTSEEGTCFITDCDHDDPDCDLTPYKKITFLSKTAPLCLLDFECKDFSCSEHDDCQEEYCTETALEEGELCI